MMDKVQDSRNTECNRPLSNLVRIDFIYLFNIENNTNEIENKPSIHITFNSLEIMFLIKVFLIF
jgi:hypothetical protein